MRTLQVSILLFILSGLTCALGMKIKGISNSLSKIANNFGKAVNYLDDIENIAELAGYNVAAVSTYWRANTLAGFAQMKRGEIEEAMETFNLAVATLAVWDLGQGIVYPIASKVVNKILLKYQDDFRNTLEQFKNIRSIMKTNVLDDATKLKDVGVLKGKLLDAKSKVCKAFQTEVELGISSKFKNTQIYADLITDLKGVKVWAKALKWADVLAGPVFDAATVALSAWQLSEAIKSKNPWDIATSSLGLASGLAGLTSFAVGALATAGSTLAAVAGPVGAIIGAVLGLASLIVELIAHYNPYNQINHHIDQITTLTDYSKKILDGNIDNLQKLVANRENFTFSYVYEVNEGLMLEFIKGRKNEELMPVEFTLEVPPKEEDGYILVGKKRAFDKSKYPNNVFWRPSGLVDLGYDFYGKKLTKDFQGVTVLVSTDLVAGKPDVTLKGANIKTFNDAYPDYPDNVVIGDLYDMFDTHHIDIKTGGGDDVIQVNGLIGKPGHPEYKLGHAERVYLNVLATAADHVDYTRKENNILSFEGMPGKQTHDYKITGVSFKFQTGDLHYRWGSDESPQEMWWGQIKGIKMFVGTPFNDIVTMTMNFDYVVRQTKGKNEYFLETTSWNQFVITIDDQTQEPGKLTITRQASNAGEVRSDYLVFSDDTRTLFIYGQRGSDRWRIRGRIFFNRRGEGYHLVRTEVDGVEKKLNQFPNSFSRSGSDMRTHIASDKDYPYYFDRNLESGDCGIFKVFLHPPDFESGKYDFYFFMRKNTNDYVIMTPEFLQKCIKKEQKSLTLVRTNSKNTSPWMLRLHAPAGVNSLECPGKDIQLSLQFIEKLQEQKKDGTFRLVVDLFRDKRFQIDVALEIKMLENRLEFQFDKDFVGEFGMPQIVLLKIPRDKDPSPALEYTIDTMGGQKINGDSLIFTEELRKWLKENDRKITMTKETEGAWKLDIVKSDGTTTHTVKLKNIERVEYEPNDRSLRQPVISDMAAETASQLDLEKDTQLWLRRYGKMYENRFVDCKHV